MARWTNRAETRGNHDVTSERTTIGLGQGFDPDAQGQDERKYAASNPVVQRLINRLCAAVADALDETVGPILDVGTGEGLAIQRITQLLSEGGGDPRPVIGVEYRLAKLRAARRRNPRMSAVVADIGMLPFRDGAMPTVLCMEVLEHLDRPADAVRELARVSGATLVVTVPFEPLFRLGNLARGKNLRKFGNDPEHLQQFNPRNVRTLLSFESITGPRAPNVRTAAVAPWVIGVRSVPGSDGTAIDNTTSDHTTSGGTSA